MKLTVFNGSPRMEKSSTKILLDHFLDGFSSVEGNSYEIFYLGQVKKGATFVKAFEESEMVLLGFPLYTDSMPGQVKAFIESLAQLCNRENNPAIVFFVQSGFPEAFQSRFVERYLEKLAKRLGSLYIGTMIKGGCNRIDEQPQWMMKPVYKLFSRLGAVLGKTGELDKQLLTKLAQPEKLSAFQRLFFWLLSKTPISTLWWDKCCRENNAFEKRFDTPYA